MGFSDENGHSYVQTNLARHEDELKVYETVLCKRGEINALEVTEILTNVDASKITERIQHRWKVVMYIYMPFKGKHCFPRETHL